MHCTRRIEKKGTFMDSPRYNSAMEKKCIKKKSLEWQALSYVSFSCSRSVNF